SMLLCKSRHTNVSNILKIIFNFGQIVRSSSNFGLYMTPKVATLDQCIGLQYLIIIGNVITRLSLSAFLLWRLRLIHNYRQDKWVCIVLFTIRTLFAV